MSTKTYEVKVWHEDAAYDIVCVEGADSYESAVTTAVKSVGGISGFVLATITKETILPLVKFDGWAYLENEGWGS